MPSDPWRPVEHRAPRVEPDGEVQHHPERGGEHDREDAHYQVERSLGDGLCPRQPDRAERERHQPTDLLQGQTSGQDIGDVRRDPHLHIAVPKGLGHHRHLLRADGGRGHVDTLRPHLAYGLGEVLQLVHGQALQPDVVAGGTDESGRGVSIDASH